MIQRKLSNAFIWLISLIPFHFGNSIHKFCTYILKSVIKYRKSVIFKNLKLSFPEKKTHEISQIADEYYNYLSAYLFETIQVYAKKNISKNIDFHDVEVLNEVLAQGQSVMILGSHYGNWEWSSMLLPYHVSHDVYAIYKPLVNKSIDGMVKEWRANFGLKLLAMDDVVKHLSKCKTPSVYIFVSDQRPANATTGRWTTFLNQDTSFFEGASVLSKRYKAALVYQNIKADKGKYDVHFTLVDVDPFDYYVTHLESEIREHPAPWLWSHNRWKFQKSDSSI
jgi:Kdo2-lipid IVA lauroyltransferase/acyltransferase